MKIAERTVRLGFVAAHLAPLAGRNDLGQLALTEPGQRFGSLSQVARTITGARWNGPRFFGLRAAEVAV
ncbi:MAG: hypothetical protein NVS3B5_23590 [Sphingomicrobium sp.]